MRVSTRARYGLRFMAELAANYGKGSVYMKDIAKSQDISEKYLSQILITLKAAGLVKGFRGVNGGYVLARAPNKITLKDIVAALEGDLCLVDCAVDSGKCPREAICATQDVWRQVGRAISQTLEKITLKELAKKNTKNMENQADMYFI
jgi:Rrf2 family transcriptional regulator, cysteine metabolism repressor